MMIAAMHSSWSWDRYIHILLPVHSGDKERLAKEEEEDYRRPLFLLWEHLTLVFKSHSTILRPTKNIVEC